MKDRASQAREVFRGSRALEYGHVEIRPSVPEVLTYCEALDISGSYIFLFSARANSMIAGITNDGLANQPPYA